MVTTTALLLGLGQDEKNNIEEQVIYTKEFYIICE